MNNYGKIFKKFRESRSITLKELSYKGISVSQLSRFENQETDLTIGKFMNALDGINMPIEEFIYATNDFQRDELNELLERIRLYTSERDVYGLKKLFIEYREKVGSSGRFHKLNEILIKIRLSDLSQENYLEEGDIDFLTNYLFSVEFWGNYELLIFVNTLDVLNHELFMVLSKEMVHRSDFYQSIPTNRRLISTMLLNGYITCIEKEEYIDAKYFEKQLNKCFFIETEIYERLVFSYSRSFLLLKKK